MTTVKYTENNQNRRRSQRSLGSWSNKGNENVVVTIESEDEQPEVMTDQFQSDNVGDVQVNEHVDDSVATNVNADDNVAPEDNEDDDNVEKLPEDILNEKTVNEDKIVITIDEGGDDESEEDEVILSKRINRPRDAKGKRKQTDECSKVTRQSSAAKKQNTIKRTRESRRVGKRKLEQKNDRRKKTAKVERYLRGFVSGIHREELHEDAPLLAREKWPNVQKLLIYARYEVLQNIKDKLSRKHLARFTESCFGKFLDIKISKFPNQLLYHMLMRQCTSTKDDKLWFNFQGRAVKFCMKDFEKITGLNCGELPEMNMQKLRGRFLNKYFDVENPIKRTIVSDLFMSMEGVKKKDRVKLAKLYLLSNFLLGKQFVTGVEINHIILLDDEELFDIYPWGRLAYTTTIESIKKTIKNPDASVLGIAGFPHALLVWAYECIPILSGPTMLCAQKVSSAMPKMINWAANVHLEWKDLSIKVFENENFEFYEMVDENEDVLLYEGSKQVEEPHFHGETSHSKQENNHGVNIPNAPGESLAEFKKMVMNSPEQLNSKVKLLFNELENVKHILEKEEGNADAGDNSKNVVDENKDVLLHEGNKQVEEQPHFHGETSHSKQKNSHRVNIPNAPRESLVEVKKMVMNCPEQLNSKAKLLFNEVENVKHILKKEEGNVDARDVSKDVVDESEDVLLYEENKQVEEQPHFNGETSHSKQENNHGVNISNTPEESLVGFKEMVMNSLEQLNSKLKLLFNELENVKHILKKEEGNVDGGDDSKDGGRDDNETGGNKEQGRLWS